MSDDTITWRGGVLGQGSVYRVETLIGWEELPAFSMSEVASGSQGSLVSPVSFGGRIVQADGWCDAGASRDNLLLALRRLMAPRPGSRVTEPLLVGHAGEELTANGRLVRFAANPEPGWADGYFGWSAQWHCPDPLRYGPEHSFMSPLSVVGAGLALPAELPAAFAANPIGGTFTADNPGTALAPAVFVLRGGISSPGIVLNGGTADQRMVSYPFNLSDGDVLEVDTTRGAAFLNGEYRAPSGGSARTIDLQLLPGLNTVSALGAATTGSPSVTVTFRPANW